VLVTGIVSRRPGRQNCPWTRSREGMDDPVGRRRRRNRRNERGARHIAAHRIALGLPVGFRSDEEECLVGVDRASERSAKLIQTKRLLGFAVGGPLGYGRVKSIVAQELE
jgi:hypothetical protein